MKEFVKAKKIVDGNTKENIVGVFVDKENINDLKNLGYLIPSSVIAKENKEPNNTRYYFDTLVEIEYFKGIDFIIDKEQISGLEKEDIEKVIEAYCNQELLLEKIQDGSILEEMVSKIENMKESFKLDQNKEKLEANWNRIKLEMEAIKKALKGSFENLTKKEQELDNFLLEKESVLSIPKVEEILEELKTEMKSVVAYREEQITSYQLGMSIRALNFKIGDLKRALERKDEEKNNIIFFPNQEEQMDSSRTM